MVGVEAAVGVGGISIAGRVVPLAPVSETYRAYTQGALDGKPATTTWWLAPFFRELYPQIELDEARMLVPAGKVITAGAAPPVHTAGTSQGTGFAMRESQRRPAIAAR